MTDLLGRGIQRLDRMFGVAENLFNLFAGLLVFAMMLLGVVQIVMRNIFNAPIYGYIDMVEISMVGFAVLSIAYVQRVGGHVRMELLITRLKGRVNWLVEALATLAAIFIVAILIPYSYSHFQRAFNFGDSTIDIQIPTWPAKLVVPLALGFLLIRLFIQLAGYLRLAVDPNLVPVGVPLTKNIAKQAEEEISQTGNKASADRIGQ
ncbi:MAG: TRAP transporter small permease [Gammaproteobacteria bacterium]|nr:TRAP transporter small permease [Gammaproteobacteria bacterium]MCY4228710.1 TRAP transporter small permease [Gammaproteobacteria bacterium]MCY4313868.1 TRAP transporter small permease [Gammaproteobacteria bacterium]